MDTQCQVNSTSAKLPALLIPAMLSSSRRTTWIPIGPLSGNAFEITGAIVSTPSGGTGVLVGNNAGPEPEQLRRFERVGGRDQVGGEAARQEVPRRTAQTQ